MLGPMLGRMDREDGSCRKNGEFGGHFIIDYALVVSLEKVILER